MSFAMMDLPPLAAQQSQTDILDFGIWILELIQFNLTWEF
jgi:hypothetical protein